MTEENPEQQYLTTCFCASVGVAWRACFTFYTPGPDHFIKPPSLHTCCSFSCFTWFTSLFLRLQLFVLLSLTDSVDFICCDRFVKTLSPSQSSVPAAHEPHWLHSPVLPSHPLFSSFLFSPQLFFIWFGFNLILIWSILISVRCSVNNCCFLTTEGWNFILVILLLITLTLQPNTTIAKLVFVHLCGKPLALDV